MKLKSLSISNFRSIKEMSLNFPESGILVLVGYNNAGKSNVAKSIDYVCGETWVKCDALDDQDYYGRDKSRSVRIVLNFDNSVMAKFDSSDKWPSYTQNGIKIYNSSIKEDFPCTYLGADRTFDKHFSFYDSSLLGRIRKQFHKRAGEVKEKLENKFEELIEIFDEVKGFTEFKADFTKHFKDLQGDIPIDLSLDFKPFTPSNYFKTMQILAEDQSRSGVPLDVSELGEGSRNLILLSLLRSYVKNFRSSEDGSPGILILEEPELFLHPQARRTLFSIIKDIAAEGMQVIISTHSSSFIESSMFDSIGKVCKIPDEENPEISHTTITTVSRSNMIGYCTQTGVPADKVTKDNIADYYYATSNHRLNEAFFSRAIVLVEGDTEEFCLPEWLKQLDFDIDKLGVSIVGVGGKNQIPKYWRLYSAFKIPVLILVDSDAQKDAQNSNRNIELCLGLPNKAIESISGIFSTLTSTRSANTRIIVLKNDYETALRESILDFAVSDYESHAKEIIKPIGNQGKALIARLAALKLIKDGAPVPEFIKSIKQEISNLLYPKILTPPEVDSDLPF